jgi:hypothetical protein
VRDLERVRPPPAPGGFSHSFLLLLLLCSAGLRLRATNPHLLALVEPTLEKCEWKVQSLTLIIGWYARAKKRSHHTRVGRHGDGAGEAAL